ncbi:putative membrane protein [Microlunatus sagamiharensis]|uniref:Putative membrane protein n=1 Tax=Microlunatus sagamiharensis TaxID=546874 RepID=A0A1H2N7T8_9ACTN|nr:YhgE/Pip domain-containing protein [Microlunatus sagamiharensis]SDV01577.1 putative membrane protein [Microlunatus sagamiharensis]
MFSLERADGSRRVGLASLIGLLLVPLVLAGGFLAATWKSTDRLDRVQAAVVNLDEPVKIDKQTVPLGRQLAGGLVDGKTGDGDGAERAADTNFSWVLTDADDARSGLDSGRYAAVVTIPKDFSARATSYSDQSGDSAEQAVLDVQTSPVSGVTDPVVGQAIASTATRVLNNTLTEQYVQNVFVGFNDTKKQFSKVADAAGQLDDGTKQLADGLDQTSEGTTKLSDGLDQLADGGPQLASGTKQLSSGLDQLAAGGPKLASGTKQLASGLDQYADGVGTLADKTAALPKGGRQIADGVAGIEGGLKQYQKALREQADQAASLPQPTPPTEAEIAAAIQKASPAAPTCAQLNRGFAAAGATELDAAQCAVVLNLLTQAGTDATTTALTVAGEQTAPFTQALATYSGSQGAAKALDGAAAGLSTKDPETGQSIISGTAALADGADQLADGLTPLAAGIKQLDTGAQGLASGAGELSSGVGQYTGGVTKIADGAGTLSTGVEQYTGGVTGVADGARQLSTGLVKLSAGADQLADGTGQLADGLKDGAKQIPTYDKQARERLSTVVAAPVASSDVTSVFSNVATTTLLAVLALWVGGLASYLVLRAVSAKALASMKSSWRLSLESLLPAAVVAAVQSVVLTVLMTALLDLGAGQVVRLLGLSLLAGLVFVALNHALVAWFGGVGRFVSVVLVVLTAAAALTSAVPEVFDSVTPLLPLTPALQGMRAVVTGNGGGAQAALLLAWLVVGLAAGVLATARHRTVRSNALVAAPAR